MNLKSQNFLLKNTFNLLVKLTSIINKAAIDMNPKIRTTGKHDNKITKNEV